MDEKLILALVAASSAVGGVLITQAFTLIRELLTSRKERKVFLREKYELVTAQVSESFLHRIKVSNHTGDDFFSDYLNRPLERIYSTALLYFPELIDSSKAYMNAYRDYYLMLAESFLPDTGLSASMLAAETPNQSFDTIVDKLNGAEKALYESIRTNASKYAKT